MSPYAKVEARTQIDICVEALKRAVSARDSAAEGAALADAYMAAIRVQTALEITDRWDAIEREGKQQ